MKSRIILIIHTFICLSLVFLTLNEDIHLITGIIFIITSTVMSVLLMTHKKQKPFYKPEGFLYWDIVYNGTEGNFEKCFGWKIKGIKTPVVIYENLEQCQKACDILNQSK